MKGSLIFNDASLPFTSEGDCNNKLANFFEIIHLADAKGIKFYNTDETHEKWSLINYSEGFSFGEWLDKLDHNSSLIVKNVISKVKCPILQTTEDIEIAIDSTLYLLEHDRDIDVKSLGLTSKVDGKAISAPSQEYWMCNPIPIIRQWDEQGQWEEERLDVSNIYCKEALNSCIEEIELLRQSNQSYLKNLSNKGNEDFPNIIFCQSALKDFKSTNITTIDFPKIIEALNRLNNAIVVSDDMESLRFNSQLTISGESTETMNRRKYSRQRCFIHPDVGETLFEQHVKNFPDGKRMHFLADFQQQTVSIGYFGHHLSTYKNPK